MAYYVAVHGGAGYHSPEDEKEVRKAMRRACVKAMELLQKGKMSCEAVESAIVVLEDSECLNAGYGANLTYKGTVECDAAIMKDSGEFGSVGALSGVKNPIHAAKAILDYSSRKDALGRVPPITLVAGGAHDFASASGITTVHPDTMVSPRAQTEWKFWSEKARTDSANDLNKPKPVADNSNTLTQDTVGAVALDTSGGLASGVSSGGILLKLPGRVGEAATFGAGCWAHHSTIIGVASSVSGTGEAIMRMSLARTLGEVLPLDDPHEELRHLFADKLPSQSGFTGQTPNAGTIILTSAMHDGTPIVRLWCVFNTASMAIAYASSNDSQPKSMILRQPESGATVSTNVPKPIYLTVLPWITN